MSALTKYNWLKHASAVLDDNEIEKQFASQAYSSIAQHAMQLMQPPYFLGFETVYANEDRTRLCGVFAFRSNRDLFYAPVFFLNGQIRGQELFYRVKQQKFVPLTDDWITRLLDKSQEKQGVELERNRLDRAQVGVDLTPMIYPRRNLKSAALALDDFVKEAHIEEENGEHVLYTHDGSRVLGRHKTRAEALAQERAIQANKHANTQPIANPTILNNAVNQYQQHYGNQPVPTIPGVSPAGDMHAMPGYIPPQVAGPIPGVSPAGDMHAMPGYIPPQVAGPIPGVSPAGDMHAMPGYIPPQVAGPIPGVSPTSAASPQIAAPNVTAPAMGGYTQEQLAAFQHANKADFDPNSAMDHQKMQQLTQGRNFATPNRPHARFSDAQLKSFRAANGVRFNPQSRLDWSKMQKMGCFPTVDLPGFIPYSVKQANANWKTEFCQQMSLTPDMEKEASAAFVPVGLLRKFLIEDGGEHCLGAIAGAIKNSYAFADTIAGFFNGDVEQFLPKEAVDKAFEKRAAARKANMPKPDKLLFHFGGIKNAKITESLFEQTTKLGFAIEDNRESDDKAIVYEDATQEWETISSCGVYAVPTVEGTKGKAIFADLVHLECFPRHGNEQRELQGDPCPEGDSGTYGPARSKIRKFGVIYLEPVKTFGKLQSDSIIGKPAIDHTDNDIGVDEPQEGKAYAIYDPEGKKVIDEIYYVAIKKKNKNGTYTLHLQEVTNYSIYDMDKCVIWNPTAPKSDPRYGILNGAVKWVEMELESRKEDNGCVGQCTPCSIYGEKMSTPPNKRLSAPPALLPKNIAMKEMLSAGMFKSRITFLEDSEEFAVNSAGKKKVASNAAVLAAHLTNDLCIPGDVAEGLILRARQYKVAAFIVEPPAKHASAVTRLAERPNFYPDYDARFGTTLDYPRTFALKTITSQPQIRDVPLNEVYDPTHYGMGNLNGGSNTTPRTKDGDQDEDTLPENDALSKSPEDLAAIQRLKKTPHVFEHGVVGALVNTFDAASMLPKYIPAWEEAVDKIGRTIFLLYWKPQDFEKLYGRDDMADIEAEYTSNFKSLGKMTLNAILRNQRSQDGTAQY